MARRGGAERRSAAAKRTGGGAPTGGVCNGGSHLAPKSRARRGRGGAAAAARARGATRRPREQRCAREPDRRRRYCCCPAMHATVAFVGAPLASRPPRRPLAAAPRFTCQAAPPPRRRAGAPRRVAAVAAALMSVAAFNPFAARRVAFGGPVSGVHAKELRYDGRAELDSKERAFSLALTAGTFAALGVWAWKQNRRDDELEEVRIREEVERLEKLRQEFMDVEEDEDAMDDEDLLASLRERLGEEGRRAENEGEGEDADAGADAADSATAVMDKGDAERDAPPNPDSLDMLKRMWDATDDESPPKRADGSGDKDGDDKPSPPT
ncbi:hypothetical protein FGB62_259g023 [Gracilaria domingensis]|nr:hypothetical protein FGB62_259g023 [Gracilaria domingensis]